MARSSLADALKARPEPPAPAAEPDPHPQRPPSRRGLRAATIYLSPAAHRQLRLLALEQDSSIQALTVEAVNDLFQKHGKPRIAG